jgi:outer membrane protein assembly factor BamB
VTIVGRRKKPHLQFSIFNFQHLIFNLGFLALAFAPCLISAAEVPRLKSDWAFEGGRISDSSAAVGNDGTIYYGSFKGELWALNPNGTPKWVFNTGFEIKSSPAVTTDGTVYFGCRDKRFYSLSPTGKKNWAFATGGWVDSSPAIGSDGTLYFGSFDKHFYAVDQSGSKRWEFPTRGPIDSSPAIDAHGRICFGSHDHKFYMLSLDGKKLWDFRTDCAITSSPALAEDGSIYFTSLDGYLYALNADGSLRWKLHTTGATESSPVLGHDHTLYLGVNNLLWVISPDGEPQWQAGAGGDFFDYALFATPAALAGDSVLFVSGSGLLQEPIQGVDSKWDFYAPARGFGSPAIGPTGRIYLNSIDAWFAVPADASLARSPWPKFRADPRNTGNLMDVKTLER